MANDNWQTPQDLFDKLNDEFVFMLDVCADDDNAKCAVYIDIYQNTLDIDWCDLWCMSYKSKSCWMNPPYSRGNIDKFCKKAYEESQKGCIVVGLLPGDFSTKWFHNYVMKAHEIRFLKRRVRFIDPDNGKQAGSPTFGSIIVVWKPGAVDAPKVSAYDW